MYGSAQSSCFGTIWLRPCHSQRSLASASENTRAKHSLAELTRHESDWSKKTTIEGAQAVVAVVVTDPLPVNRARDAAFLIDTGAPNVLGQIRWLGEQVGS